MNASLPTLIRDIQGRLGVVKDGVFGRVTAGAVLAALDELAGEAPVVVALESAEQIFDERSERVLETLDPKAQPLFRQFLALAQATAATLGCDVRLISGHRSWAQQDALYNQPRDGKDNDGDGRVDEPDEKVTNARGGQSNHNFGIAADVGVFRGKAYLDNTDPQMAAKVHKACSVHAAGCGLEWGGSWRGFKDLPHYEVATGLTTAQKRARYQAKGSVL